MLHAQVLPLQYNVYSACYERSLRRRLIGWRSLCLFHLISWTAKFIQCSTFGNFYQYGVATGIVLFLKLLIYLQGRLRVRPTGSHITKKCNLPNQNLRTMCCFLASPLVYSKGDRGSHRTPNPLQPNLSASVYTIY